MVYILELPKLKSERSLKSGLIVLIISSSTPIQCTPFLSCRPPPPAFDHSLIIIIIIIVVRRHHTRLQVTSVSGNCRAVCQIGGVYRWSSCVAVKPSRFKPTHGPNYWLTDWPQSSQTTQSLLHSDNRPILLRKHLLLLSCNQLNWT